eukprot:1355255-Rhodomonas_salina.2
MRSAVLTWRMPCDAGTDTAYRLRSAVLTWRMPCMLFGTDMAYADGPSACLRRSHRRKHSLSPYLRPTRCPVLTQRIVVFESCPHMRCSVLTERMGLPGYEKGLPPSYCPRRPAGTDALSPTLCPILA